MQEIQKYIYLKKKDIYNEDSFYFISDLIKYIITKETKFNLHMRRKRI